MSEMFDNESIEFATSARLLHSICSNSSGARCGCHVLCEKPFCWISRISAFDRQNRRHIVFRLSSHTTILSAMRYLVETVRSPDSAISCCGSFARCGRSRPRVPDGSPIGVECRALSGVSFRITRPTAYILHAPLRLSPCPYRARSKSSRDCLGDRDTALIALDFLRHRDTPRPYVGLHIPTDSYALWEADRTSSSTTTTSS